MKIDENEQEIRLKISDLSDYLEALEVERMRAKQKKRRIRRNVRVDSR